MNTFTVIGTFWSDSSRLRAVTTISSRSLVCANAGVTATIEVPIVANAAVHLPAAIAIFFPLSF